MADFETLITGRCSAGADVHALDNFTQAIDCFRDLKLITN